MRYNDTHGFSVETADLLPGDEAGVKSATLFIKGHNAYGYLRSEKGIHRLVRISPFDAAARRHTSFSACDIMQYPEDVRTAEIIAAHTKHPVTVLNDEYTTSELLSIVGNMDLLIAVRLHVNIDIAKGEFVFIVGASGAGKSTFIKLLLREVLPSAGQLRVNGRDVIHMTNKEVPYLRRGLGVIFQDYRLLPDKTVFENIAFAMKLTIAKYYTPSGRSIDGTGIEPDVAVDQDPNSRTDQQLLKAVEVLREKLNP